MPGRLDGKIAIVTGASSGIGASAARLFLQEGALVMIVDRDPPSDKRLVAAMAERSGECVFRPVDVSDESQVQSAIAALVEKWGGLTIAVSSAGISINEAVTTASEENWDRTMAVNVKGVFFVTKYAVPEMLKCGGGSIINISSVFAMLGSPYNAAYCASKGAVRSFTKAAAIEYVRQGIRANSIHPGVIETPGLQGVIDRSPDPAALRIAISNQQPNGFSGEPDDIGWACVYLASDESKFVSGSELVVDHGASVS